MTLNITPSEQNCGAFVTGLSLNSPLSEDVIASLRAAWLDNLVLVFPDQRLSPADILHFAQNFGAFGPEPFVTPHSDHPGIVPVERRADETGPLFAGTWHTDWSFLKQPPIGTCLYSLQIPPTGGDTLFANQYAALSAIPDKLRQEITGKRAIHSARNAYAPDGTYRQLNGVDSAMQIDTDDCAHAETSHPIIHTHAETGQPALYGTRGHIVRLEGLSEENSKPILGELFRWQTRPEFQFRLKWAPNMLVMWDNRALIHMATGGYQGHARKLLRTMIGPNTTASPNVATGF